MIRKPWTAWATGMLVAGMVGLAHGATITYYDETAFKAATGSLTLEGFETVKWDSWIYHTRLPSPIHALDLVDDPADPNDGPDYDLDGHFDVTGNSIAYAPADELFKVIRDNDNQYLSFSPWYNALWPKEFDPTNQHPIVTFDNFDNSNNASTAFGLSFLGYTPNPDRWIVMELGDEYVPITFSGTTGNYFVGFVSEMPFDHVRIHSNQNGGSIKVDGLSFQSVPEPSGIFVWLTLIATRCGIVGWQRRRQQ